MSNTMTNKEITEFVRKVRHELKTLTPEDLKELTENLESDLMERLAEEGPNFKLGNAADYAAELAEAAGLNISAVAATRMNLEFLRIWNSTLAYLRTLSPAWAIVRGWLLFALAYSPVAYGGIRAVPVDVRDWLVLTVLVALSIWLGLKRFASLYIPLIVVNTLLMLGGVYLAAQIGVAINDYRDYKVQELSGQLSVKGHPVNAACGYDQYGGSLGPLAIIKDQNGDVIFTDVSPTLTICR